MNVGSVVVIPWGDGDTQTLSRAKELFELFATHRQLTQKVQAWAPSLSSEPPGETFSTILFSRRADPDESDAGCGGAGLQFRTDGLADAQTERVTAGLHRWVRRAQRARAKRWRCRRNWSTLSSSLNWLLRPFAELSEFDLERDIETLMLILSVNGPSVCEVLTLCW